VTRAQRVRRRRLVAVGIVAVIAVAIGLAQGGPDPVARLRAGLRDRGVIDLKAPPLKARPKPMPLPRALGQEIVASYKGTQPPKSLVRAAQRGRIGGVILFARNVASFGSVRRAIRRLQDAAHRGGNPPLLIMADQEGGSVKRFGSAPPSLSPAQMGAARNPRATALAQGSATAHALRGLGVNVDLAPVADVPPTSATFLADRAFGHDPGTVTAGACGFAAGLARGGVAATLKHYPGLGRAPADTDIQSTVVTAARGQLEHDALPYRRCAASVPLVMVSSAIYPSLSGHVPAVLSRATYRELSRSGFRGVTISDDLETPALAGLASPGRRAINAGLDLLLYSRHESTAQTAYLRLRADLAAHRLNAQAVRRSAERIVALKRRAGA
jgi:beta-N-acetylhexosaminidase